MGRPKIKHLKLAAFESHHASFTAFSMDLAQIWPEAGRVLNTPVGSLLLDYAIAGQSDEALEANLTLLKVNNYATMARDSNGQTVFAKLRAVKGDVAVTTSDKGSFGWAPAKGGGIDCFVESWPGYHLEADGGIAVGARRLGWKPLFETALNIGVRRVRNVADVKAAIARNARLEAEIQQPPRLATAAGKLTKAAILAAGSAYLGEMNTMPKIAGAPLPEIQGTEGARSLSQAIVNGTKE